jgi:SagB-type dehydrogenase family enzyme
MKIMRYLPLCLVFLMLFVACEKQQAKEGTKQVMQTIDALPPPQTDGTVSVEKAIANRRSHRNFTKQSITIQQLSQILWAAYGVTMPIPDHDILRGGLRTAPSAGGRYPFEIYIAVGEVENLAPGLYLYDSAEHLVRQILDHDIRESLFDAAWGQEMIRHAPATIIYTAVYSRMTERYGNRGRERYVAMDLGHSAQNIYLQAEALGLGTCAIGAFQDDFVSRVLHLPKHEEPLYLMPIGHPIR